MKFKKIMFVGILLLAIFAIGAVSALCDDTVDNVTSEIDELDDSISVGNDEQVLGVDDSASLAQESVENSSEILSDAPTKDDFSIDYEHKATLSSNSDIISIGYYDYGGNVTDDYGGNVTVSVNGNRNISCSIDPYYDIRLTVNDLGIVSEGEYDISVDYISDSGTSLNLLNYTLFVKNPTKQDIEFYDYYLGNTITPYKNWLLFYFRGAIQGNLTVNVNGYKKFEGEMCACEDWSYIDIYSEDLELNSFGTYTIDAEFKPLYGSSFNILKNLKITVGEEMEFDPEDFYVKLQKIIALNSDDYLISIGNYFAGGNYTISINGSEYISSDTDFYLSDLNIDSTGTYDINISYTSPSGDNTITLLSDEFEVIENEGHEAIKAKIFDTKYGGFFYTEGYDWPLAQISKSSYGLSGDLLIYFDDVLYYNKTINTFYDGRIYLFDLNNRVSLGNHLVQVKYDDNGNVTLLKTAYAFIDADIKTDFFDEEIPVCSQTEIEIFLPSEVDGKLYVTFDGNQTVLDAEDITVFNLETYSLELNKTYTVEFELRDDSFYPNLKTEIEFRTIPNIIYPSKHMASDETQILSISLPSDYAGSISLYNANYNEDTGEIKRYGEAVASANVVNGTAQLHICGLSKGMHYFTVEYVDEANAYQYSKDFEINVAKNVEGISVIVDETEVDAGDFVEVTVVESGIIDQFYIYLDGEYLENINDQEPVFVEIPTDGQHIIKVSSYGYDDYDIDEFDFYSVTFIINENPTQNNTSHDEGNDTEFNTAVAITDLNGTVGHDVILTAKVSSSNNLTINEGKVVFFDGSTQIDEVNVGNGVASLTYTPSVAGEHIIMAVFSSDNYSDSNSTSKLFVDSANVSVLVNQGTVGFNSSFVAEVKGLYSTINEGVVKFYVDDSLIGTVNVVKGSASLNYVPLNAKTYTVKAVFTESNNFLDDDASVSYVVSQADSEVLINDFNTAVGHDVILTAKVSSSNNLTINEGKVVFFDGSTQIDEVNVGNGVASLTYTPSVAGEHIIRTVFTSSNYLGSNGTAELTVKKASVSLSVDDIATVSISNPSVFNVNVFSNSKGVNEGSVKYYVNNILIGSSEVSDGKTRITYIANAVGVFNLTVVFDETDNYLASDSNVTTFTVAEEPKPIAENDMEIPSLGNAVGKSVNIKLPGDATGKITLSIGGKDYIFDVVKGVANVQVPELSNGNYPYTITYSGDGNYSRFVKSGSFTVDKQSAPIIPKVKTTLTLKKVKVKRSAKKLTIQATLKINGKSVKNKVIKFKFNKKTYKARTNAKGVAKITVKKSVLKKLKKGKKVTYTATYGKITKKVTVKVK